MSRSKRGRPSREARGSGPTRGAPRPARRPLAGARIAAGIAAIALLGGIAWWRTRRAGPGASSRPASQAVVPVPLDSVAPAARMFETATIRGDWADALRWQQRIAAALPTNPLALRQLGQTLHNHRYAVTLPDGRTTWLLRNSLERAEWEALALALFDSSAAVTNDPLERARAHYWKGRSAEYEGLPLDALAEYDTALAIVPQDTMLRRVREVQRRRLTGEP